MSTLHPDYLPRNSLVATAYGLEAGISKIMDRLYDQARTPIWLMRELEEALQRASKLIRPLIEHRNEVAPAYVDRWEPRKE